MTPEQNDKAQKEEAERFRVIILQIVNGYVVKHGPKQTYCADLAAVSAFLKYWFEQPRPKVA